MLQEKYHFNPEECKKMADFLLPMLEILPEARSNAGGMSNHAFMDGTIGMENTRLDIAVGSRGEGIEGWATEVKKQR